MGWTERRKLRADKHRAHLLAATQQLFERLEDLSSCPARGASPVQGDDANAEQNTPDLESPAVHDACGHGSKTRRLVTVEEYPWKFVSPQLLDGKGREILYPVEDDRDRWWARKLEGAVNHHRDLAERDLDGLQAFSLDIVRRVQQKMEKEKCCFCLARKEHDRNLCESMPE
jgi:hypothetical protein